MEATRDLDFVREWVKERYAQRGRPGIDPVVFFTPQLVLFFEAIHSERRVTATASLRGLRFHMGQRNT